MLQVKIQFILTDGDNKYLKELIPDAMSRKKTQQKRIHNKNSLTSAKGCDALVKEKYHNNQRCTEVIVYLEATGSIVNNSKHSEGPFYVYKLVFRYHRRFPPLFPSPLMSHVTTQQPSDFYFLCYFQNDHAEVYGPKIFH